MRRELVLNWKRPEQVGWWLVVARFGRSNSSFIIIPKTYSRGMNATASSFVQNDKRWIVFFKPWDDTIWYRRGITNWIRHVIISACCIFISKLQPKPRSSSSFFIESSSYSVLLLPQVEQAVELMDDLWIANKDTKTITLWLDRLLIIWIATNPPLL